MNETRITLSINTAQAAALTTALEVYTRLGIGQIEHLAELIATGIIPTYKQSGQPRQEGSQAQCETTRQRCDQIKATLGYPINGSHGIGHPHVDTSVHRAYEIRKVLAKAMAEHRNPNPASGFRGVDYDGLIVRYTMDPEPTAFISEAPGGALSS